jgi:putative DNA primase/helicase
VYHSEASKEKTNTDGAADFKGVIKPDGHKFDNLAGEFFATLADAGRFPLYHHGQFYLYDGRRYVECNGLAGMVRRWMRRNGKGQSNNIVGNVTPIIENLAWKEEAVYPSMPFYAGEDPWPSEAIAFNNGILDLSAGELRQHTPFWCSSTCLPYNFDPSATCPQWEAFLDEVFEGDGERIALSQEWFGYCLTHSNHHQKYLWLKGPAGAGKSTWVSVLESVLGPDYVTGYSLYQLARPHGVAMLLGKALAVCGEVDLARCKDKNQILETFKRITGNDPVEVDQKFRAGFSTRLNVRFILNSNEHINFVDRTNALGRRLLALPFNVSFRDRADPDLPARLAAEVSGIANWAIEGLRRLRRNGRFTESSAGREFAKAVARQGAYCLAFLQDRCTVYRAVNPGGLEAVPLTDEAVWTADSALRAAFQGWGEEAGLDPFGMPNLGRDLADLLPKVKRVRRRVDGKPVWVYQGIGLRPPDGGE